MNAAVRGSECFRQGTGAVEREQGVQRVVASSPCCFFVAEMSMVSLVTRQGCRTRAAAKRLISAGSGASWEAGTGHGGVSRALVVCFVVFQLQPMVQSGAEQGVWSSSTMTWQWCWAARGAERGTGVRAGEDRVVWEGSWIVVGDGGAGRVVSSSKRHVLTNASPHSRMVPFAGRQTAVGGWLRLG